MTQTPLFRIYPGLQKQPETHTAGQILILSLQVAGQADPQALNTSFGPVHLTAEKIKKFEKMSDVIIKNIKLKIIITAFIFSNTGSFMSYKSLFTETASVTSRKTCRS